MSQYLRPIVTAIALLLAGGAAAHRQNETRPPIVTVDPNGTVHVPSYSIPTSVYMSAEAKKMYIADRLLPPLKLPSNVRELRRANDRLVYGPLLTKATKTYAVHLSVQHFGSVAVDVVEPAGGISRRNAHRVLINLHGGGNSADNLLGLLESLPISAVGKTKVISPRYREPPEAHLLTSVEDVVSVYKEVLKHYRPENIGIYGCSVGAALTASTVSWLIKNKMPLPGAIGLFCWGADFQVAGDSAFTTVALIEHNGDRSDIPPAYPNPPASSSVHDYLGDLNPRDSLVAPAAFPAILANFPPTLVISGTRDICMSSAVYTHTQLVKAGRDAELHVWEGMWHSFFINVDIPESKEMYDVTAHFFDSHLGDRHKKNRLPSHG